MGHDDWDDDWFDGAEEREGATERKADPAPSLEHASSDRATAPGMDAAVVSLIAAEVAAAISERSTDRRLVDPPDFGDRIRGTDKEPFWIPGAFPIRSRNETGNPYEAPVKEVDFVLCGPHVLRSRGWHAHAHVTFMYWWMNLIQRFNA